MAKWIQVQVEEEVEEEMDDVVKQALRITISAL